MLLAWLLPESNCPALSDGWARSAYQPRHGKPPLIVRAGRAAAITVEVAWDRYLGPGEDGFPRSGEVQGAER